MKKGKIKTSTDDSLPIEKIILNDEKTSLKHDNSTKKYYAIINAHLSKNKELRDDLNRVSALSKSVILEIANLIKKTKNKNNGELYSTKAKGVESFINSPFEKAKRKLYESLDKEKELMIKKYGIDSKTLDLLLISPNIKTVKRTIFPIFMRASGICKLAFSPSDLKKDFSAFPIAIQIHRNAGITDVKKYLDDHWDYISALKQGLRDRKVIKTTERKNKKRDETILALYEKNYTTNEIISKLEKKYPELSYDYTNIIISREKKRQNTNKK